jgi:diguanylate cyclase (GGDEF)-like protein/PAS domain S-box-containing protein
MRDGSTNDLASPKSPLQILLVEDDAVDVDLCLKALINANLDFHCDSVSTIEEFSEQLSAQHYDIVLSDYRLKGWTGMGVFALLQEKHQDTPFVLVTGLLGDEMAVECLRNGVDDYVLKDNLARLPSTICRVLKEKSVLEQQRRAEAALRGSEAKFRTLAEATASPMFIYQGTECKYANRAAEVVTGYSREELIAMSSWEIIHPDSRDVLIEHALARLQGAHPSQRFEIKILTKQGDAKWLEVTIELIDHEGKPAGLFTGFDITGRKSTEEEVLRLVASDPLTGLVNIRRLMDAFETEVKRSRRTGRPFVLAAFDLDGLKSINDAYGHLTGSRALCRLACVLRNECRTIDIVARNGGDEFAVILPDTTAAGAQPFVRRICERLSTDGQQPSLSVSIGTAVYPENGQTYEELFGVADRALYEMKRHGRGKLQLAQG